VKSSPGEGDEIVSETVCPYKEPETARSDGIPIEE